MRPRDGLVLGIACLARLVPVLAAETPVADVARYQKVARHVLDESWNPYQARRLYPYPPVWVLAEAGSEWIERRTGAPFAVVVKLPVVAADLLIVGLLLAHGRRRGLGAAAGWAYALHPVSLLITGFHGQFDSIALASVLLALHWHGEGKRDLSALALAAGIALKSFPVLLLPFFLLGPGRSARRAARFAVLALGPVALLLLPFALADFGALRRELFAYSGIADFGWIGLVRGVRWLATGRLARSEPEHWARLVPLGKGLFLAGYAALVAAFASGRVASTLEETTLAVFLGFQVLYGAVSAQYLLWVVPLGCLSPDLFLALHGGAATVALLGFYPFLAPGVLGEPPLSDAGRLLAGRAWVVGTAAVLIVGMLWLATLLRRAAARGARGR